jgi:GDP-L-fucose synthase
MMAHRVPGEKQVNIGSGSDITIMDLARLICDILDYRRRIELDTSKPDGTPRKLLDSRKINAMGWKLPIELSRGIRELQVPA